MHRELAALDDEELFLFCRDTDSADVIREAVALLATRHRGALVRYLGRYVRQVEVAEDLAQEAFIRIYKHARGYKEVARVRTWLFRIATNLALNEIRNRKRRPARSLYSVSGDRDDLAPEIADPSAPNPARETLERELQRRVREAVALLPDHYRSVVLLCDLEGFSYQEAAEVLEVKIGTVRSRLFRARERLRKAMAPLWAQGDL